MSRTWHQRFSALTDRACRPDDSPEERTKKGTLTLVACIIAFLAIFWGSGYVLLGRPLSGAIPLGYALISFLSIGHFFLTRRFEFFRFSQLLMCLLLPFLLQTSLGGFAGGSVVMVWAFFAPLAAMLFADAAHATRWLYAYLGFAIACGLGDHWLLANIEPLPQPAITAFFVLNMGFGFGAVYLVLSYFVKDRERTHREALHAKTKLEQAYRDLEANQARVIDLMLTDPLTGVANRRHLDERLKMELSRAERYDGQFAVVMVDADHFKRINDEFGHTIGDEVLQGLARILLNAVRNCDLVARYGGEEFVLCLPETGPTGAVDLANRIRATLARTPLSSLGIKVTASFGIATAQKADTGVEDILRRADRALYRAKHEGRNCVRLEE